MNIHLPSLSSGLIFRARFRVALEKLLFFVSVLLMIHPFIRIQIALSIVDRRFLDEVLLLLYVFRVWECCNCFWYEICHIIRSLFPVIKNGGINAFAVLFKNHTVKCQTSRAEVQRDRGSVRQWVINSYLFHALRRFVFSSSI